MSGHSPRPWSMCDPYRIQPVDEWAVQIENEMQMIGEVYECDDFEEMQANGRLFAAAPDLLEACKAAYRKISGDYTESIVSYDVPANEVVFVTTSRLIEKLLLAIQKAEGK